MHITKSVIQDLFPLYAANECSDDTRRLVEAFLQQHPQEAKEWREALELPLPRSAVPKPTTDETQAFARTKQALRARSWCLGVAIFFSLAPFSFYKGEKESVFMIRDAPQAALAYAAVGVVFWLFYFMMRRRTSGL